MSIKICYVWVESFRNFENFGFNLSSSSKFHFNSHENNISKIQLEPLPVKFFGENIIDVVGIIGKNGAGKSNAVELVCKILKGAKSSLNTDFFIIVEERNRYVCYYSFQKRTIPETGFDIEFQEYNSNINPLKVVFFSNVFDERRNDFHKEVADISFNNLYRKNTFSRRTRTSDFEKQINLIDSKIFSKLNIDLPTKVQLTSKAWTNRFNSSMERSMYGENFESIKELKSIFRDRLREMIPKNKFIHLFRFGYFLEIYNDYMRSSRFREVGPSSQLNNLNHFITSLFNKRTDEISEKMIEFLRSEILFLSEEKMSFLFKVENKIESDIQIERFKKQIDFLINLKYSIDDINFEYNSEGARNKSVEYFTFEYNSQHSISFINKYISLFGESNIFEINWLGISSGHKAYLNLFSSIFKELRFTRQPNLLLCIDEGDLYLHPMWQTEFFDKLLTVLPLIYSGNIQLVLTSHSPFLLSDLPKQNITILDKDRIGASQDGIDLKNNTFGGNLYDLYSEPFFLGKKRTSDFAYSKIKELIASVEKKSIQNIDKESLLRIADLIGDEIIQFQIKKLLKND